MKKLFFIITLCVLSVTSDAKSIFDYNKSTSFGIQFGAVDQQNHFGFQTLMGHISIYGVYVDVGGWPRSHQRDIRVDKWDDESCFMFHVGYQFPLCSWFKITPIAGYYKHESGMTDGYHWKVDNYGINNRFDVHDRYSGFDYGVNAMFHIRLNNKEKKPGYSLQLGGTYTKNAWYAGLGLDIAF
jgi:hypothetical protein